MEKEITINCKVEERWIPIFVKMFEAMEYCGQIGHSEYVGLYADGDGDFKRCFLNWCHRLNNDPKDIPV